jgi:hypothetical protein
MTDNKQEPTFELQSWFDGGDIFFRPKDKSRFVDALDAIVENDLGVAIIGTNEVVLDHYSRMLIARLREIDRFQIDVFLPVTTDSLLVRFNDMLSEISLEQAAKPPLPEQPVRLLMINDARVINDDQWGLLVRLLADFPGVNARLVLVINKSGWPGHEKLLHSLGKRMHRWPVAMPATEEARQLLVAAEESGYLTEVEALLVDAGMGALVNSRHSNDVEEPLDPDLPDIPELDVDVLLGVAAEDEGDAGERFAESNEDGTKESNGESSKGGRLWPTIMLITLSLALSLLVISWLYPDFLGGASRLKPSAEALGNESLEPPSYTIESIAVPTEEQLEEKRLRKTQVKSVPEAAPAMPTPEQEVAKPVTVIESLGQPSNTETPTTEMTPTELVVTDAPSAEAPTTEAVLSDLMRAANVLASASPRAYFVQHIVLSSELAAKAYIGGNPGLVDAAVVPLRLSQKDVYGVISGPFASRAAAALFTQDSAVPDDYWIRGAAQLQAILRR